MSDRRKRRTAKTIEDLEAEDERRSEEARSVKAERAGRAYVPGDVGERRKISKPPRPGG